VRHPTYKHLEAKLRLGSLSLGQWVQITTAGTAAATFGVYVSPLPTTATIFVSIVGAGMPVALSYGAMGLEFSVAAFAAAAWRYWHRPRHYLPGSGESAPGYVVMDEEPASRSGGPATGLGDREPLWDL
jgi:hypothetical protein